MATPYRHIQPLCDTNTLRTNRVLLVQNLVLGNVMQSVAPLLIYSQVDEINGGKTRGDQTRKLLDVLQLLVSAGQYEAFNAFILAVSGTQPELFVGMCGRVPTVPESDFCMTKVVQELKSTIGSTKHNIDSKVDEQIDLEYEYVEVSMDDKMAEGHQPGNEGGNLPHEYGLHLQEVQSRNRSISVLDVLGGEDDSRKKVSIYGRAGVGKSTTMQFMAKQWALGRWAAGFTMLFLIQLRLIATQVIAISTVELLSQYGLYDFPDVADSISFTSWLRNAASRILILIDGLDEICGFAERMQNTPRIHDVLQKAHPVDLCVNILRGDLLPGCTVISASRPFAGLSQLPADARAEILGLTSAKVTEFVERRHPQHSKNIMSVLRDNPILLSVCSITFYCMLVTRLLSEGVVILDEDVGTYTRLMSFVIVQYCSRKMRDFNFPLEVSSYFSKLAKLAHSGIFHSQDNERLAKLVFDDDDLVDSNISPQDIVCMENIGILQVTNRRVGKYESKLTAEFFHLSAQELLAVAHFVSHPPFPHHILDQLFHGGQFNLALQFIFGLQFDRRNTWISKIRKAVGYPVENQFLNIETQLSSYIKSLVKQKEKLTICQLIHEGQWEEKAKELLCHIAPHGKLELGSNVMTAIDLLAVDFACRSPESLSVISLYNVNADDTFVEILVSSLCQRNLQTLQVLYLYHNVIGAAGAKAIADSLWKTTGSNQANAPTLRVLDISFNSIGDEGAIALGGMLANNDNLQELHIAGNDMGEEGMRGLSNGLNCNAGLKKLKVDYKHVDGSGVKALADALQHNACLQVLDLGSSSLGDDGVKVLAASLHTHTSLTELNLSRNEVGDDGAKSLAAMLGHNLSLHTLDISINLVGDVGAQAIADSMYRGSSVRDPIQEERYIKHGDLGDAGATAMADGPYTGSRLVDLDMTNNAIGNAGAVAIATMLRMNTSLVELHISDNNIGDAGAIAIARAFSGRNDQKCSFCTCLARERPVEYNTTLRQLLISRNMIGPDGEKALTKVRRHNTYLNMNV